MSSKPVDQHPYDPQPYDPSQLGNPYKALLGILAVLSVLGLLFFGSIFGIVYGVHRMRVAARQAALEAETRLIDSIDRAANDATAIPPDAPHQQQARQAARIETPVANLEEALALAEHGDESDYRRVILWMASADDVERGSPEQRERLVVLMESRGDVSKVNAALGTAMAKSWRRRRPSAAVASAVTDALAATSEPTAPPVTPKREKTEVPTPTGPLPKSLAERAREFGASLRQESDPAAPNPFPSVSVEPSKSARDARSTDEGLRRDRPRTGTVPLTTSSPYIDKVMEEMRERQRQNDEDHRRRMEEYRARDRERMERALQPRSYIPPSYPR